MHPVCLKEMLLACAQLTWAQWLLRRLLCIVFLQAPSLEALHKIATILHFGMFGGNRLFPGKFRSLCSFMIC